MKIIVSRFNENIEWSTYLKNVVIYNKGEPLGISNEIMMPNVGREGHTIYSYICDNYDSLDDHIVFVQGYPFDHSPNLLANLRKCSFGFLSEKIIQTTISYESKLRHSRSIYKVFETIFGNPHQNKIIDYFSAQVHNLLFQKKLF